MKGNIVVAMTGASGAAYGVRLIEVLLAAGYDIHLTISRAGRTVLRHELGLAVDLERFDAASLELDTGPEPRDPLLRQIRTLAATALPGDAQGSPPPVRPGTISYHHYRNGLAPVTSGSFRTAGMVICPCSFGTLSAIAHGISSNVIHRAAEVHLKERRRLILVPRETPLSLVQIESLRRAAAAGAIILPAMPGFYHRPTSVRELVDFVVARICDQLQIPNELIRRWGPG